MITSTEAEAITDELKRAGKFDFLDHATNAARPSLAALVIGSLRREVNRALGYELVTAKQDNHDRIAREWSDRA